MKNIQLVKNRMEKWQKSSIKIDQKMKPRVTLGNVKIEQKITF